MSDDALPFVLTRTSTLAEPNFLGLRSEEASKAARFWAGNVRGSYAKAACAERLQSAWHDPKRIAEVVAALRPNERTVLAVVRRYGGNITGTLLKRELLARGVVKDLERDDPRYFQWRDSDPVFTLCEHLLLVKEPGYYDSYFGLREYPDVSMPANVAAFIKPATSLDWEASAPLESPPGSVARRSPAQMMVDLQQMVAALRTQGLWKVNQGGTLPTAGQKKLNKLFPSAGEDPLEPPNRVALLYSLLHGLGIIAIEGSQGRLDLERAERLLRLPGDAQLHEWIRAWIALRIWQDGIGAVPDRDGRAVSMRIQPDHIGQARDFLVWALTRVAHSNNDWLDLETFFLDVYAATGERGLSFYWGRYAWEPRFVSSVGKEKLPPGVERLRAFWMDDEAVWAANALLSTLVYLGAIERGRIDGSQPERWAFRLTEPGKAVFGAPEVRIQQSSGADKCLTVQPNHEIVLYLDIADGPAISMLGRIATRESAAGIVQVFKLTRDSVYAALEGGMTLSEIESFLKEHSRNDLPSNVLQCLSEWSRKRESLVVRGEIALCVGLRENQGVPSGRALGNGCVVISTEVADKQAKALHVPLESNTQPKDWKVDEHGVVLSDESMSVLGKARLRRLAMASGSNWRITPESVRAARNVGLANDQLLAWLQAHAKHEVPKVLETAIRQWAGARNKAFLGDVVLLQVKDADAFDALRRSSRLRPFIQGTLAPGCFIVSKNKHQEAKSLLSEWGFSVDSSDLG